MLNPSLLKSEEGLERIREMMKLRNIDTKGITDISNIIKEFYELQRQLEDLQAKRNNKSKEIGIHKAQNNLVKFEEVKKEVAIIAQELKNAKEKYEIQQQVFDDVVQALPNLLAKEVPPGKDEAQNILIKQKGEIPSYDFEVKPHYEVAEDLDLVDFSRGVKLAGSRFYVYNAKVARLERQLLDFMLREHEFAGYEERMVPVLVKDECMFGTGQFPKFKDEYYSFKEDGLNLIPTAEVPLTNLYSNEILTDEQLPISLTAASSCFRREAGSAGRDTRGLVRVHQFQKVELVKFVHPDKSETAHEELTQNAANILDKLELTYRIVLLSSGDTSASSSKTYDLEVYMPGLKRWLEISSCSNFLDYQSRRAKIRFKDSGTGKNRYVHTLNGSGVAAGRLIAALLEYHQNADGSINWTKINSLIK